MTDSRLIAVLPGPGEWKISIVHRQLVLASPYSGMFTLHGTELRKVPPDWDGKTLGKLVEPPK